MVQQQQQRIVEQQQQQQQKVLYQQQQGLQQTGSQLQEPVRQSEDVSYNPLPCQLPQAGSQSGLPKPNFSGQEMIRQSADIPGYRPQKKQVKKIL